MTVTQYIHIYNTIQYNTMQIYTRFAFTYNKICFKRFRFVHVYSSAIHFKAMDLKCVLLSTNGKFSRWSSLYDRFSPYYSFTMHTYYIAFPCTYISISLSISINLSFILSPCRIQRGKKTPKSVMGEVGCRPLKKESILFLCFETITFV